MYKKQLIMILTAFIFVGAFAMQASSQTVIVPATNTTNITYVPISGNISLDPNNYEKVTDITQLTIYAKGPTGMDNVTSPAANGTFSMMVPGPGNYSIRVFPSKLSYLNASTNVTYQVLYPDGDTYTFYQNVTGTGLAGIVIPTKIVATGKPMNATPMPPEIPSPTPTTNPTPGFTAITAFLAIGAMTAIAFRKK
jgi:hypothetical protein